MVCMDTNSSLGVGVNPMKLFIHAKPSSKTASVQKLDDTHYIISIKEPPKENKANFAIMKALAERFGTSLACVRLVSGASSKQKTFEIA